MSKKNEKVEEEIKSMEKHTAGLVRTILDLKSRVEFLEKKGEENKNLGERKQVIEESISANSDAVKRLEKEITSIIKDKNKKKVDEAIKRLDDEIKDIKKGAMKVILGEEASIPYNKTTKDIKCRYFNGGFCKFRGKCRFNHPKEVCEIYKSEECDQSKCGKRHPKACKWVMEENGCQKIV